MKKKEYTATTKKCLKCGEIKPLSKYNRTSKGYVLSYCSECYKRSERFKNWKKKGLTPKQLFDKAIEADGLIYDIQQYLKEEFNIKKEL